MKGQSKKEWSIQHNCKKAEELGLFDMGSTIILLIENPAFENCDKNYLENPVRLGMKLA